MRRLRDLFSLKDLTNEQVRGLSNQELASLWLRLERKRRFFMGAFAFSSFVLLLATLAQALRTRDAVALAAAIAVVAAGFLSYMSRGAFAVVDREQDRRSVRRAEEAHPPDPELDILG
jgi:cytochrome c-type biogenesis protein CcmH/NrfG